MWQWEPPPHPYNNLKTINKNVSMLKPRLIGVEHHRWPCRLFHFVLQVLFNLFIILFIYVAVLLLEKNPIFLSFKKLSFI